MLAVSLVVKANVAGTRTTDESGVGVRGRCLEMHWREWERWKDGAKSLVEEGERLALGGRFGADFGAAVSSIAPSSSSSSSAPAKTAVVVVCVYWSAVLELVVAAIVADVIAQVWTISTMLETFLWVSGTMRASLCRA